MKKIYQAPQTSVYAIMGHGPISVSPMQVGGMVEDTNDIGFTKENDFDDEDL